MQVDHGIMYYNILTVTSSDLQWFFSEYYHNRSISRLFWNPKPPQRPAVGEQRGEGDYPMYKTDSSQTVVTFWKVCGTELCNIVYQRLPHTRCFSHVLYSTQTKESGNEARYSTYTSSTEPSTLSALLTPDLPGFRVHYGPWESQATSASNPLSNGTPISLVWRIYSSMATHSTT